MTSTLFVLGSASIVFALGTAHLFFTFRGPKLKPRASTLTDIMRSTSPGISSQTTMWKAWLGFNASHSVGAMLFGAIYGYLAVVERGILFDSVFLGTLGLLALTAYTTLGWLYWFSTPFRATLVALALYIVGYANSVLAS